MTGTKAFSIDSELYLALLNSTVEGIWSVGLDGCITFVNSAAVRMFGYASAADMIGKNSHELVHHTRPDGTPYPRVECPIYHAFQKETSAHLENELLWRADGTSFYADYRATPLRANGKVIGTVTTFVENSERVKLMADLQESRAWLQATLTSIGDAVIVTSVDPEPKITFMNPVAEALTGWDLKSARGLPVSDVFHIIHSKTRQPAFDPIDRVIREGLTVGLANSTALISKSGREFIIEDSAAPIRDADDKLSGVVVVFRDATERHKADERNKLFNAVLEYSKDFIGMADANGKPIYVNPAGRKAVGLDSLEDVLGTEMIDYFAEEEEERVANVLIPAILRDGSWDGRVLFQNFKTGERIPFSWNMVTVPDEETGGIVALACISKNLKEQEEREKERDTLLVNMKEADRRKDEFLAVLSHELRSPLNVIAGHVELLRIEEPGTADFEDSLDAIARNTQAQTDLIADLLDISRIVTGKMMLELRNFEVEAVIKAAADSVRFAAEAKGIRLQILAGRDLGSMVGDATRLQQVFWNLLSNAVKFTPKGGRIIFSARRVDAYVEFRVDDTGQGITNDFLPHVFDRFHQEDASKTRKYGGLGLGLAIVRHIAELHGGSVRVESAGKGLGASFFVILPVKPIEVDDDTESSESSEPLPKAATKVQRSQPLDGLRILVVDDQPDARDLLRKALSKLGASLVEVAASAEEALAILERNLPDVIVSDVGMPVMNGLELIREWRKREYGRTSVLPAIALTAYATEQDHDDALTAGFQRHLIKPVKISELVQTIRELVGRN